MLLKPKLTRALYFKILKNDILKFQIFWKKYAHVDNDVYFNRATSISEINCFTAYTKKTKSNKI
jgi:hypothetical protein